MLWELSGETYSTTDAPSKQQLLPRGTRPPSRTWQLDEPENRHKHTLKAGRHTQWHAHSVTSHINAQKLQTEYANGNVKHTEVHTSIIKHKHANTLSKGSRSTHEHVMTETDSLLTLVPDNGSELDPRRRQTACNLLLSELTLYSRAGEPTGLIVQLNKA